VVAGCVRLLEGGDTDDRFIRVLGGPTASWWLANREDEELRYWPRVWGARAVVGMARQRAAGAARSDA
jgi:hypothetical protein